MAVFRIDKTRDYTVMANHHLRNKELSLKAKGLLSLMLSLPEDWDYTTKGLSMICKDGVDSICSTVKELEKAGYVQRRRIRDAHGRLTEVEYTILEQPVPPPESEPPPKRENPVLENPVLEKPEQVLPKQAEPEQENPAQLNTKKSSTKKSNTDLSNTHSFFPSEIAPAAEGQTDGLDKRDEIREQIEYDFICQQYDRAQLDELVEIMLEVAMNRTLVATWEAKQVVPTVYIVLFNANGGSVTPSIGTTGADGKLSSLPTPTRSGSYSFDGWFTAKNGGTKITTSTVFTADTTVYAHWTYTGGGGGGGYVSTYAITVEDAKNGDVTVSHKSTYKGATVTVTVDPDKGYSLETLTVTDKNGKEIELNNKGDGKYTFKMPGSKVTVKATFMDDNAMLNFFVDVPADAYYYDAVLWAVKEGITNGTSATTFSPDMTCTRAQAVTFLWRAAGSPEPKSNVMPFEDVAAEAYYYKAVLWAVENGITKGTSATTFSPDADCTRAQIVTFLWRAQKSPAATGVNPFTDVAADAYYVDAVLWAVTNGITAGTSATTFSPAANCTRAQIVTFLYRCLG